MLNPDTVMPKAYSYLRFSTPEQSAGNSTERQIEAARRYAEENGLEIDESLQLRDEGVSAYSGDNVRKGALGQFLRLIDDDVVPRGSILLVENLDRVSRRAPWDAFPVFQQIVNAGITVVTLQDNCVYEKRDMQENPFKIMQSLFVMMRANEESKSKSTRLKAAWEAKRRKAAEKPLTSKCPQWLYPSDNTKRGFSVHRKRANVVRRIYEMAHKGEGQEKIARSLNSDGVETFGKAKYWQRSYVAKLLRNEAVIGTLTPHRIEYVQDKRTRIPDTPVPNYYPPIVSKDLFYEVQRLIGTSAQRGRHAHTSVRNILSNLARCPHCEGTMTRISKGPSGGRVSLVCANAKQGGGCVYKSVQYDLVEEALLRDIETFREEAPRPGETGGLWDNLRNAQVLYDAALEDEERLYRALGADANASDMLRLRTAQEARRVARDEKECLERLIDEARNTSVDVVIDRLEALTEAKELDRGAINVELRKLLDGVTINSEPHFESLTYHFLGGKTVPGPVYAVKPAQ